jgi:hypothetical protein
MARATYTPNAPLLLTNIQYNLTSTVPVKEPVNLVNFYFDYAAKIDNILLEARSW